MQRLSALRPRPGRPSRIPSAASGSPGDPLGANDSCFWTYTEPCPEPGSGCHRQAPYAPVQKDVAVQQERQMKPTASHIKPSYIATHRARERGTG